MASEGSDLISEADAYSFIEDVKQRVMFENLPSLVTKCTSECVRNYEGMYLKQDEEVCVKQCYLKTFEFQNYLNQEL